MTRDQAIPNGGIGWAKAMLFVLPFLLLALGSYGVVFHPDATQSVRQDVLGIAGVGEQYDSPAGDRNVSSQALYLPQNYIRFLNRIYHHRSHEIAYCGLISANNVLQPWLADTKTASPSEIEFTTENCPIHRYPKYSLMHTHPDGSFTVSEQDQIGYQNSQSDYLCIQSGPITLQHGTYTEYLRCYHGQNNDALARVPVKIIECEDCL